MPVDSLPAGTSLGPQADGSFRYVLREPIGEGGFGITYLAEDQRLKAQVVVKELASDATSYRARADRTIVAAHGKERLHARMIEKFLTEARLLSRFRSQHIVRVTDVFCENGTAYYVMDHVRSVGRIRRMPPRGGLHGAYLEMVLTRLREVLYALQEVHAAGLVHGDVKPDNILLDAKAGSVLIDFGAARSDEELRSTITSTTYTPGYAPFELTHPSRVVAAGAWSDIYSVGMMLIGATIGHPSDDWRPVDALSRSFENDPYPEYIREMGYEAHLPDPLVAAMDWAVRLRPEQRPQSVQDWLPLLRVDGEPEQDVPAKRWMERWRRGDVTASSVNRRAPDRDTVPSLGSISTNRGDQVPSELMQRMRSRSRPADENESGPIAFPLAEAGAPAFPISAMAGSPPLSPEVRTAESQATNRPSAAAANGTSHSAARDGGPTVENTTTPLAAAVLTVPRGTPENTTSPINRVDLSLVRPPNAASIQPVESVDAPPSSSSPAWLSAPGASAAAQPTPAPQAGATPSAAPPFAAARQTPDATVAFSAGSLAPHPVLPGVPADVPVLTDRRASSMSPKARLAVIFLATLALALVIFVPVLLLLNGKGTGPDNGTPDSIVDSEGLASPDNADLNPAPSGGSAAALPGSEGSSAASGSSPSASQGGRPSLPLTTTPGQAPSKPPQALQPVQGRPYPYPVKPRPGFVAPGFD